MDTIVKSLLLAKMSKSHTCSASHSPLFFHFNASSVAFSSVNCHSPNWFLRHLPSVRPKVKEKNLGAVVHASDAKSPSTDSAERWLLEPVGDGDTRHIGFKVERPGAYEIVSSEVTVRRAPEKADLVILVATVMYYGVPEYKFNKKEGNLLVTDLDSTNGTFIDDQRLRPGKVATVPPGSCITFGDTYLAMFRVSKVENAGAARKLEETEAEVDSLNKLENIETT